MTKPTLAKGLAMALSLAAPPALADTPEGYYASGWPIALAEAACDGDEACLTQLADCGPGATDCIAGVALCTFSSESDFTFTGACRSDVITSRHGKALRATLPSGEVLTLFLPNQGTAALNGRMAERLSDHCVRTFQDNLSFCARPLTTEADFNLWRQETGQ
ncbi:hypothetical protein [Roseovarius sp. MMSF_3281]|uniref:hypothetical protein n=1 Tax=Roseovarius sp. MMSF_3281 TaxID=3046694 RepID=UPI0027402F98|nr:hypothetical protein [Roseovarius sp. MMSF_3281]